MAENTKWARSNDEVEVTVRMFVRSPGESPAPDRKMRIKEVIEVHRFPYLLPFGMTVFRINPMNYTWSGRCGHFTCGGTGTDVDKIAKLFVEMANQEVLVCKWDS